MKLLARCVPPFLTNNYKCNRVKTSTDSLAFFYHKPNLKVFPNHRRITDSSITPEPSSIWKVTFSWHTGVIKETSWYPSPSSYCEGLLRSNDNKRQILSQPTGWVRQNQSHLARKEVFSHKDNTSWTNENLLQGNSMKFATISVSRNIVIAPIHECEQIPSNHIWSDVTKLVRFANGLFLILIYNKESFI